MYLVMGHASSLGGLHVRFTSQPFISISLLLITGGVGLPEINGKIYWHSFIVRFYEKYLLSLDQECLLKFHPFSEIEITVKIVEFKTDLKVSKQLNFRPPSAVFFRVDSASGNRMQNI